MLSFRRNFLVVLSFVANCNVERQLEENNLTYVSLDVLLDIKKSVLNWM